MTAEEKVKAKWPDAYCAHIGQKHIRKYAIASLKANEYLSGWMPSESAAWEDAAKDSSPERLVKEKYPKAVATFGTAGPFKGTHNTLSVIIWADSANGPIIGRGTCLGPGWEAAELAAWEDAAKRIRISKEPA